jgi:hypothetical protein
MNDENGMLNVEFSFEENEKGEDILLVQMDGGPDIHITFTQSTPDDKRRKAWRGIRTIGLFLATIYMLEEEYCSSTGTSTVRSCDRFPFALLTLFSCFGDSLAEWFCILFVLVTLRTLLVTAKVEYLCYREEQIAQRLSVWDYFVKYGYQRHEFDKNKKEETIGQRTIRIAKHIAQEIWRSVIENTFMLVTRILPFLTVFRFLLRFLFCMLATLLVFMGMILFGAIVAFGAFLVGVLGTAIQGMLGVVLLIAIRVVLQFQFFIKPTISLVFKILHF